MKTENKKIEKSTIQKLREIRDKVSDETQNMTFEELKKYIEEQMKDSIHPNTVWKSKDKS